MIARLTIAREIGVQYLKVNSDSWLVMGYVIDEYDTREENMKQYLQKMKDLISIFHSFDINGTKESGIIASHRLRPIERY